MDCTFCKIIEGEINSHIIYKDDLITCFLDIEPINEGHVLIIPNKHYLDIDEIPNETLISIMSFTKKIVKVLKERYSPDGYSIMQNGGVFNDIGHYHLHVFPRYREEGFGWNFSNAEQVVSEDIAKDFKKLLIKQNENRYKLW
ncbi:MAG: HIT family protein [Clostridium sartagoforme]|nr:HIT family protein [Clostridium sartagoforme]